MRWPPTDAPPGGALGGVRPLTAVAVVVLGVAAVLGGAAADGGRLATLLVLAAVLGRGAGRCGGRGGGRARLLAATSAGGAALATAAGLVGGEQVAGPLHLALVPLGALALLAVPHVDGAPGSDGRCLLDGAVSSVAVLAACLAVGAGGGLARPVADVFVLGALVGVLARVAPAARRALEAAGAGLALVCVADVLLVLGPGGPAAAVLSQAGLLLLVGAIRRSGGTAPARGWPSALPEVCVVLALLACARAGLGDDGLDGLPLLATLATTLLLLARQAVGARDRRALTQRLQTREELFRSLVNGGSDLITLSDRQGTVLWASPAVGRTVGAPHRVVGSRLVDHLHPDDLPGMTAAAAVAAGDPQGVAEALCRVRSVTGQWRWMQVLLQDRHTDPAVRGLICNARDVHERHLLERQLNHAAYHDPLTGLGNLSRARELLRRRYGGPVVRATGVVLVDLDGFKSVNDTFGHAHGDALLAEVARRLRASLRDSDEVMRIGGDEFVLVLSDPAATGLVAERVLAALREPVLVAGALLAVGASIGTASAADAASPDELLRNADLAMYASKAAGRDRITVYESWMHERATHRMRLQRGLRRALDDDLLALHYQPIVDLADGRLVAAEALLRWLDPELGQVSPGEFIPVAEESGIIAEIDVWVIERACRDISAWLRAGVEVPRVSINVSRRHMTEELPALVERVLRRHGLDGSRLCLEVTESAVVADGEVAIAALARVRELGVTVALDDFGSGQSSLSQLARLPVDSVKIDMGFTQSAREDAGAQRLLTSIVRVCQSLALPVVAEGIEDQELSALLAGIGCQLGQGWHYGRPQSGPVFTDLLGRAGTVATVPRARRSQEGAVVLP